MCKINNKKEVENFILNQLNSLAERINIALKNNDINNYEKMLRMFLKLSQEVKFKPNDIEVDILAELEKIENELELED